MNKDILTEKIYAIYDLALAISDPQFTSGIDQCQSLRMIAETAQSALRQAVVVARDDGASWETIGKALGITRQGAYDQFGKNRL